MKFSISFATVLAAALALTACAKKDSDFAARYAKNKMGAEAANTQETGEADTAALEQGVDVDIIAITRNSNAAEKVVTSTVILNNQQTTMTTRHTGTEQRTGELVSGNTKLTVYAVCANANCNPYYVSLQVYKDGKLVIQEGVRKYFDMPASSTNLDRYAKLKPERSLPLIRGSSYTSADIYDGTVMVGYLSGNATGSHPGYQ